MIKAYTKKELDELAKKILDEAKKKGVEQNFLFTTTFDRYLTLTDLCARLKREMKKDDLIITKTYVKDRENRVINPAVHEYSQTVSQANKTAETLMRIIKSFASLQNESESEKDPLAEILNGDS